MKNKKKGSALIITLVLTLFIMVIMMALFTLTISTTTQVNAYNKINSAYYASESGFERTMSIIQNSKIDDFASVNLKGVNEAGLKSQLDSKVNAYVYNILNAVNSKSSSDKITLINNPASNSYYIIKGLTYSATTLVPSVDLTAANVNCNLIYTIPMVLSSEGHITGDGKDSLKNVAYKFKLTITFNFVKSTSNCSINITSSEIDYTN